MTSGFEHAKGEANNYVAKYAAQFWQFLISPRILILSTTWTVVFVSALFAPLCVGFGSKGVRPGSRAAKYQSQNYGGHTPRDGTFANLTRVGMMGTAGVVLQSAVLAACMVTGLVWAIRRYIEQGW
ncbi:hypothetical protein FRC12_024693 [Ceratobasidium sp. 428]|nr:hypothetical protein FRC12_024693 [Ceratobasidium sp. 428]